LCVNLIFEEKRMKNKYEYWILRIMNWVYGSAGLELSLTYSLTLHDLLDYWETYLINGAYPRNYPLTEETLPKFVSFVRQEWEKRKHRQARYLNSSSQQFTYTKDTLHLLTPYYEAPPLLHPLNTNEPYADVLLNHLLSL
jgi:hypothetical protein